MSVWAQAGCWAAGRIRSGLVGAGQYSPKPQGHIASSLNPTVTCREKVSVSHPVKHAPSLYFPKMN